MQSVFGRTNESFPSKWISLGVPDGGFDDFSPQDLVAAARNQNLPIYIGSQPALWGGMMRGSTDVLLQSGTLQIEKATSEEHASDLVQAHLIETLSCLGRETIDFYFLRIRRALEEYQINGALAALEYAKQEGHVRFLGLRADGPALSVLGVWQFHDAFEALWVAKPLVNHTAYETLVPMAEARRVGVLAAQTTELAYHLDIADLDVEAAATAIHRQSLSSAVLVPVRTLSDLELLREPVESGSKLEKIVERSKSQQFWDELQESPIKRVNIAAHAKRQDQC